MRELFLPLIFYFLLLSQAQAEPVAERVTIGFKDSLRQCLKSNFDIQISALATQEKEPLVTKALGEFDLNLKASYSVDHSEIPSASSLDGVATAVISDTKTSKIELKKKFSILGTEITLPYSYAPSTSNSSFARIPEGHNTSLGVSLTQPLIKPFYSGYLTKNHHKAQMDLKLAQAKHGDSIDRAVQKAIQLYLEVIQAFGTVKLKELSKQTSGIILEKAQQKEAHGAGSLLEKMEAEAKFQRNVESFLTAQLSYEQKKEEFANHVFATPDKEFELQNDLGELEQSPPPTLDIEQEILQALQKKPELKMADISLELSKVEEKNANVDQLPSLNLDASQTNKGLGSSFSESQSQVDGADHVSTSLALRLEMPLVGYAAQSEKKIKNLKRLQEELKRQNVIRNTKLEIMKSLRQIEIQWKRLEALRRAVEAETVRFEGQTRKYEQGRISITDLNQALQDKEDAQLELLKGRVNYVRARYDFFKSRGSLLEDLEL